MNSEIQIIDWRWDFDHFHLTANIGGEPYSENGEAGIHMLVFENIRVNGVEYTELEDIEVLPPEVKIDKFFDRIREDAKEALAGEIEDCEPEPCDDPSYMAWRQA